MIQFDQMGWNHQLYIPFNDATLVTFLMIWIQDVARMLV